MLAVDRKGYSLIMFANEIFRSYAYLEFEEMDAVTLALVLNDTEFKGRMLKVCIYCTENLVILVVRLFRSAQILLVLIAGVVVGEG